MKEAKNGRKKKMKTRFNTPLYLSAKNGWAGTKNLKNRQNNIASFRVACPRLNIAKKQNCILIKDSREMNLRLKTMVILNI